MCLLCGPAPSTFGEFGIAERPAEEFSGIFWEGAHEDAAAGAVRAVLKTVQARAGGATASLWDGPIVAVSWSVAPGWFRTFVGIEAGRDDPAKDGWEKLTLPAQKYVSAWHGAQDGDVVERYGRMIEWVRMVGHARAADGPHHREEYPRDGDFDGPPVVRLMLPVV